MSQNEKLILDENLHIKGVINSNGMKFIEVGNAPFSIHGLYDCHGERPFRRMNAEVAKTVSTGVSIQCFHTSGGRIRFSTNSRKIAIKVKYSEFCVMSQMTALGSAGFDLYKDKADGETLGYFAAFVPPCEVVDSFESEIDLKSNKMRSLTINMPLYSAVESLYIGVEEDAFVGEGEKYRPILPVLYYGSSITQGACATRPGNAYQAIISRRLNIDYVSLGFGGNCKAEPQMNEYLAAQEMSAFVCDYDHNCPDKEYLAKTHFPLYETIREKHPDIPYIMISRPDYRNHDSAEGRRQVIIKSYNDALELGDKNIYFVDGKELFNKGAYEDICTVDGIHPNDMGFAFMADGIGAVLKKVLKL